MKEATYLQTSWEGLTRQIKAHLGINCLTPELAKAILALYIKGASVKEILNILEGTE